MTLEQVKSIIETRAAIREQYAARAKVLAEIESLLAPVADRTGRAVPRLASADRLNELLPHGLLEARRIAQRIPLLRARVSTLEPELRDALASEERARAREREAHADAEDERRRAFRTRVTIATVIVLVMFWWLLR